MTRVPLLSMVFVLALATTARPQDLPYEDSRHLDSFDGWINNLAWSTDLRAAMAIPEAEAAKGIADLEGKLNQVRAQHQQHPKVVERRARVERLRLLLDEIHGRRPPGPLPGDRPLEDQDERAMGSFDGTLESRVLRDVKAGPEPAVRDKLAELARTLNTGRELWNHELRARRYRVTQLQRQVTEAFGAVPRPIAPEVVAEFKRRFDEKQAYSRRVDELIPNADHFKRHKTAEAVAAELRGLAELEASAAGIRSFIAEFTATWGPTASAARNNLARIHGSGDPPQLPAGVSWPFDWAYADSIASIAPKLALPRSRSGRVVEALLDITDRSVSDHLRRLEQHDEQAVRIGDFNLLDRLDEQGQLLTETARLVPDQPRLQQAVAGLPAQREKAQTLLLSKIDAVEWPGNADDVDDALVWRIAAEFPDAYAICIPGGWGAVMEKRVGDTILTRKDGAPMGWGLTVLIARRIGPDEPQAKLLVDRAANMTELELIAEPTKESPFDRTNQTADDRLVSLAKLEASAAQLKRLREGPAPAPAPTPAAATAAPEVATSEPSPGVESPAAPTPTAAATEADPRPEPPPSGGAGFLLGGACLLLVLLGGGVLVVGVGIALYLKSRSAAPPTPPT